MSDHYGWEVIELHGVLPSVTGYAKGLVRDKGLSNMQTTQLKFIVGSNFLLSPLYGKIRFFGRQVLYLDIYLAMGGGFANTETIQLSTTQTGVEGTQSTKRQAWDPTINVGLGFKIFLNNAMALAFDLRDYILFSQTYDSSSIRSNFSVVAGLSFFLPVF